MRVILTSHGSTGDIYPVIALAVAMQRAGHQVRFATIPHYQQDVEDAGIEFLPLCPDWEQADLSYWMGRLQKIRTPIYQLRELYVGAHQYIPEMIARMDAAMPETDLVVSSYLFPMNKGIADRHHVPFATLAFAPHVIPSPDYPPENLPSPAWLGRTTRRAWNRWMWQTANAIVDRVINSTVAESLRAAGLPKVRNFFSKPAEQVVVTLPESIFRRPDAEIDSRFKFTGYCRWQAPEDPALDLEIASFTQGEPVPIITFGSMVYENAGATMERFVKAWPADRKIIVQRGWAQFPRLGDESHIKVIGKVSHDQLFKHASCIIHHGGAGTTGSALHAGKPQLIVPHIGDQNFFGMEMERIGVGLRLGKMWWPDHLHTNVDKLLSDPQRPQRAADIAAQLRQEDGPAQAISALESFVAHHRAERATASTC
ncbi:glycosyltransferase [Synoicihabitans lomoniglobus]|uniref:Glycosyltransferase n=1 Tax=Synoicihabitans lomoniglobus TaxID=2909285 RepID=A0AAF0I7I3_9BACT|nr:glycosyltransferase [Opitutaceae bacterium LMO-M01]WED66766.1 glycosyltransferase [Opitutaceae bacterium LMO-M01]